MIGVCTDDGECVGGPELRLLRRNQEQVQVKSEGRRAKTECRNREEWGHHVPNRGGMEKWKEDRARTSQQEDIIVGWNRRLRWGGDTVVRDNELTGDAETNNASSGFVKDDGRRRRALRTRDCGKSRDVLHGSGRTA